MRLVALRGRFVIFDDMQRDQRETSVTDLQFSEPHAFPYLQINTSRDPCILNPIIHQLPFSHQIHPIHGSNLNPPISALAMENLSLQDAPPAGPNHIASGGPTQLPPQVSPPALQEPKDRGVDSADVHDRGAIA